MRPIFWKLSQSPKYFTHAEMPQSMSDRLVYVHQDTNAKGFMNKSQADNFIEANVGDYFYLTNGNNGIYLLGQFVGPANILTAKGKGWMDRPFRQIATAVKKDPYGGEKKWWAPSDNSTFMRVPDEELGLFESEILTPFFNLQLGKYQIKV